MLNKDLLIGFSTCPDAAVAESLARALVELHPCEAPEVVALPIIDGHDAYLRWIESAAASTGD